MSRVTTVVATRDRWTDLLDSLTRHEPPVILVDNGSTDGTPDLVRAAFPLVHVIGLGHNAGAVARNVGVRAAGTPYVAFADDDSWWAPGALDRAAELLDMHPGLGLVAARILVGEEERLDPVCRAMASSPLPPRPDLPGPPVLGFAGCGAIVRREAFLEAGGFDEVVHFGGEEERLALDLAVHGWALAYVEDVVAHHHPSSSRSDPGARQALLARNRILTALMRRPWSVVGRDARRLLLSGGPGRRGILQAACRSGQALRRRAVVPADLEHQLLLLEEPRPERTGPR